MRGPRELYLGPKDNPNPERVREAMSYARSLKEEYIRHYEQLESDLSRLLSEAERRRLQEITLKTLKYLLTALGTSVKLSDISQNIQERESDITDSISWIKANVPAIGKDVTFDQSNETVMLAYNPTYAMLKPQQLSKIIGV
jgi:hypothetical protein